jgi:DNA invertase Pin-like site-specific DNA recombinase
MKHRAISYLRYSSKGQAIGDSERRQEESFNRWLLQNSDKYIAYEPFRDLGRSGYSGGHLASGGSLGRLLQQAKEGVFGKGDLLVVEAIDRLSRLEPLEAIELYQEILKTGLTILTLEDNQNYSTELLNSGGFALLTLVIKSQASHEYSKRLGSRIKSAHDKKRISAENGEAIKVVSASWLKDGKIYEPIAVLVRKAIDMYLNGYGTRAIAMEITSMARNSDLSVQRKYKKPIDARTIRRWLDNPALIGNWKSKYKLISGCFEPLIDFSTWMRIQEQLEFRKTNKISAGSVKHYKLSGLVVCHQCGSPLTVRVQKPRPTREAPIGSAAYKLRKSIQYLNCSRYLKSGACENNTTWPYQVLEYIYEQTINECLFQMSMGLQVSKGFELKINELTENIAKCEEKFLRAKKLFIDYGEDRAEVDFLQLKNELESLKIERDAMLLGINQIRQNNGEEFANDGHDSIRCEPWEAADDIGKRKILKEAGYSIVVANKNAECWYSNKVWNIIKRNQNSRTYTLEEKIESEENSMRFVAINDEGREVAHASSLAELSQLLDTETMN